VHCRASPDTVVTLQIGGTPNSLWFLDIVNNGTLVKVFAGGRCFSTTRTHRSRAAASS
jgi:hypothetical protein